MLQWLALLLCVVEVLGLNLSLEAGYRDCGFLQLFHACAGIYFKIDQTTSFHTFSNSSFLSCYPLILYVWCHYINEQEAWSCIIFRINVVCSWSMSFPFCSSLIPNMVLWLDFKFIFFQTNSGCIPAWSSGSLLCEHISETGWAPDRRDVKWWNLWRTFSVHFGPKFTQNYP